MRELIGVALRSALPAPATEIVALDIQARERDISHQARPLCLRLTPADPAQPSMSDIR
jgi:hypothetical protein